MAESWLRLETKMMFAGWTSELPDKQYAAFVKFLQAVKSVGRRGGKIQKSYFNKQFFTRYHISENSFCEMLKKAKLANGDGAAVTETLLEYEVNSWETYQLDPTASTRKRKSRKTDVTNVTGVTGSHECHDDGTGRDVTGRDVTSILGFDGFWEAWPEHPRKESKTKCREVWKKDKLDRMAAHVIGVVEAMKESKQWANEGGKYIPAPLVWLNKQRWDRDLNKLKAAIAREKGYRDGAKTDIPQPSDHRDGEPSADL